MTETIEHYKQRMLSYAEGKDLLSVLSQTGQTLARLTQGAPDARLRERPAPGKWSVAEILAHIADVEIAVSWRIRSILGDPGIKVQAYDQDAWVASGHYEQREPAKSLELEHQSAEKLKAIGVKLVTDVDKSGFAKIAAPYQDKLAKDLGPHAVKIKDLIGAVK